MKHTKIISVIISAFAIIICFAACANPQEPNEKPELGKGLDFGVNRAHMAIADEKEYTTTGITVDIPADMQDKTIMRNPQEARGYAVFLGQDSNEYTYFLNSDVLIGVDYGIMGMPVEKPKTEKEAERIARDLLEEHFDNFAHYDLFGVSHYESSYYYGVRFAYQKYGYAFQDIIVVNVTYGGEIMGVKAPRLGEFYDCPVTKEQLDKTVSDLGEGIAPMGVLYDDNHVLCYTYMKDDVQYYVPAYTE